MPGYGIVDAKSGDGLLRWSWAVNRLSKTQNYFLSTVRNDGRPHVMPIWGVWVGGAFYFSTGKKSVKARNLAENASCVLCPGGADEAVILEGAAEKVASQTILKKFGAAYLAKYNFDVTTMNEPVYVIHPRVVFGQIEKTFTKTATRWTF
jgi:general stress protein 26